MGLWNSFLAKFREVFFLLLWNPFLKIRIFVCDSTDSKHHYFPCLPVPLEWSLTGTRKTDTFSSIPTAFCRGWFSKFSAFRMNMLKIHILFIYPACHSKNYQVFHITSVRTQSGRKYQIWKGISTCN